MPKAVPELAKRLENDHWLDRRVAAQSLSCFGREEELLDIVPFIGDRLDEMNRRVRIAAASTLADISKEDVAGLPSAAACRAVPELFKRLADPDIRVRHDVKEPLKKLRDTGAMGEWGASIAAPAVPDLLRRLQSDDWRVREAAAKAIGNLGGLAIGQTAAELVKLHGDEGARVRNAAKAALDKLNFDIGMVGAPAASKLVQRLQFGEDWRAVCGAAYALGQAGQSFVVALGALSELLSDADAEVRFLVARALGHLGLVAMPIAPQLANLVDDLDERVRLTARTTLVRLSKMLERRFPPPDSATRRLMRRLEDQDNHEREAALRALGALGPSGAGALPAIMRHLGDNMATVRTAAVVAVHQLGKAGVFGSLADPVEIEAPPPIIDALLENLEDENWAVRLACAEALSNLAIASARVWQKIQKAAEGKEDPSDIRLKQGAMKVMSKLRKGGALIARFGEALEAAIPELQDSLELEASEVEAITMGITAEEVEDIADNILRQLEDLGHLQNDPEPSEGGFSELSSPERQASPESMSSLEKAEVRPASAVSAASGKKSYASEGSSAAQGSSSAASTNPLEDLAGSWCIGDSKFQLSASDGRLSFLQCLEDGSKVEGILSFTGSNFTGGVTKAGDAVGSIRVQYHDGQMLVNYQEPGKEEWWDTLIARKEVEKKSRGKKERRSAGLDALEALELLLDSWKRQVSD